MTNQSLNIDGLVKSHQSCHSREGGNLRLFKKLDPLLLGHDYKALRSTFYELTNIRNHRKLAVLFFIFLIIFCGSTVFAQETEKSTVKVTIAGLKTDDGQVKIEVFNSEETWIEKSAYNFTCNIQDKKCECIMEDIPYGEYALFVYQDKNSNDELDAQQEILPTEPFGYSRVTQMVMGPARWSDTKFSISSPKMEMEVLVLEIPSSILEAMKQNEKAAQ